MNTFKHFLLGALALSSILDQTLFGATLTVNTIANSGSGSLREKLTIANNNDTIQFDSNLAGTITLQSSLPLITVNLTILGNGQVAIDGANQYQIFFVHQGIVAISNLEIKNGLSQGGNGGTSFSGAGGGALGAGGGLYVNENATVTLTNVAFNDNYAVGGNGGASSNIYFNSTGGGGGGGYNLGHGGSGGANFGNGGGGGGGGGFNSLGGNAVNGGGGGGGFTGTYKTNVVVGAGNDAAVATGGNGGNGTLAAGGSGGAPNTSGSSSNPITGGGGGGGGGTLSSTLSGGFGGNGANFSGGGGGGGGSSGGYGGYGSDFGGGGGSAGNINAPGGRKGGNGGYAGGGGGGAGGPIGKPGKDGGMGGFGAGGGGGGYGAFGGAGGDFAGAGGNNNGSGGGGVGLGGAIFVRDNGTLNLTNIQFNNNCALPGVSGAGPNQGQDGDAAGRNLYFTRRSSVTYNCAGTETVTFAGNGQLFKDGVGTLTLNVESFNDIIPDLIVKAGTLICNSPGDYATVYPNGILQTNLTLNGLINQGTVSLGPTIGDLQINGDFTQTLSGKLNIKINPSGQTDVILCDKAKLDGKVVVNAASGAYTPGTKFIILNAQGGRKGTFHQIQSPSVALKVNYSSTKVELEVL